MPDRTAPLLLIADGAALPRSERVWGTGGWLDPTGREGLDWLTLARLAGWGVDIAEPDAASMRAQGILGRRWVIVTGDMATLSAPVVDELRSWLVERAVTVVARASPNVRLDGWDAERTR